MAETLYVLYETGDTKDTLEEIHYSLVNEELFSVFPNEFEYFTTEWDEDNNEESFFGRNDPERMRSFANNWNARLNGTLRKAVESVRQDMESKGYGDFVDYAADFRNSLPLYWLRKALNESTGRFQYGHNYAAQTGYSGWGTVLSDKDIENINSHPENYAVIMCLYH